MPAEPMNVHAAQHALLRIAAQLEKIDSHLALIAESLEPRFDRSLSGELRLGAQCVRDDLLSDAIDTLGSLGRATEASVESRRREVDVATDRIAAFA